MTTIKWIILTLFLSSILAAPAWERLVGQDSQSQTQTYASGGGDGNSTACCIYGLDCCEGPIGK